MKLIISDPEKGDSAVIPRSLARKRIGVSATTWWRLNTRGAKPPLPEPVKIGGRWFYRVDEFEAWRKKVTKQGLQYIDAKHRKTKAA